MIIHIFASRPLNKDKNYIFIVVLSSLSPILLDSIKKQAKNASKRLKIGKSAELFPHFSQRCEFFPPPPRYRKRELCTPVVEPLKIPTRLLLAAEPFVDKYYVPHHSDL